VRRPLPILGVLLLASTCAALVPAPPAHAASNNALLGIEALGVLTLPQPEDSPADPNAVVPIVPVAEVEVPRIGLSETVYEGVEQMVIDQGPAHWSGSAAPGSYGNTVLAGHRVSHTAPFRDIDRLVPGDTVVLRDDRGEHVYRVTATDVVTPEEIGIVDQRPGFTITLFACHPPGSAAYRYVVHGELVTAAA
jgi:sortase A